MQKLILMLISAVAIGGCAQAPQLSPKGDAIFYALQADTMMNTWRYECGQVSSRANYLAESARTDWWRRNGSLVEAADFGLAYNMVTVTDTRQDTGARLAMALTWEVQERANALVDKKLSNADDKDALCNQILSDYRQGSWDIKGSEEIQAALQSMKKASVEQRDDYDLKRGRIEAKTKKSYGRSLYVVEQFAEQEGCEKSSVQLIKGEWPYEIYDVVCDAKPFMLMRCEWGRCATME